MADFSLTILHTNDVHGRFEPISARDGICSERENIDGKCFGGVARLHTAIQEARQSVPNSVLLDGGDQFQGSLLFRQYKGQLAAEMMNTLGYDAMTLGNHEFGSGVEALRAFIDKARFPVLMANGDLSGEPALAGQVPKSFVHLVGGEQVAFIGIVPENTAELANPGPTITFSDPYFAVGREVTRLTARGIDKIILLSHAGYYRDLQLAEEIEGIDVIVGGHSHTFLHSDDITAEGPYPTMVGQTAIVQAYAYGRFLGRLDVIFDDNGQVLSAEGEPILMNSWVPENPFIKARIEKASAPLEALRDEVVGSAESRIDEGLLSCRVTECPIGNLVADAMLASDASQGAEIALMNSGGIKGVLDKGPITMGDVMITLPFQNTLATFTLTGQELREVLENGVSRVENSSGRFPQVAGMRFAFKPFEPTGNRIAMIEIDGEPIDLQRQYKVVSNSFLRGGGDGYTMLRDAREAYEFGPDLADVLADYLKRNLSYTPVTDERIEILID
ncbi:MAG: bifunctional metallophosphatase/5'-nucleotidase [Pseudomonadota bacterium]